jgi:hypothetical protein
MSVGKKNKITQRIENQVEISNLSEILTEKISSK